MNACTPRGHYFVPVRQFGQRYSFVKEVPIEGLKERHFAWDTDRTLDDALTLSRLIRDNGYSTQYAARLLDYEDGQPTSTAKTSRSGGCTATASGSMPLKGVNSPPFWRHIGSAASSCRHVFGGLCGGWPMHPVCAGPTWYCRSWSAGSRRC
jgi:hypothetical protein